MRGSLPGEERDGKQGGNQQRENDVPETRWNRMHGKMNEHDVTRKIYFHKYMKEGGTSCFYYNLVSVKCTESEKPSGTI